MQLATRFTDRVLAGFVFIATLSGCAHQVVSSPDPAKLAGGETVQKTVGLYMSDHFMNYQLSENKWGDTWQFSNLGLASANHFRAGLEKRFKEVKLLKNKQLSQEEKNQLTAIIEADIAVYTFDMPLTKFQDYPATIEYKLVVLDASGTEAISKIVNGVGDTSGSPGFDFATNPVNSATHAIEAGVNLMLDDIVKLPMFSAGTASMSPAAIK